MKRNFSRNTILLNLTLTFALLCLPALASAFGGENGDAKCSECHSMDVTEAREKLKDIVADVHGVDNLFIAGSSIFPTSGATSPTLTIVCLTLRLADHLKPQLNR